MGKAPPPPPPPPLPSPLPELEVVPVQVLMIFFAVLAVVAVVLVVCLMTRKKSSKNDDVFVATKKEYKAAKVEVYSDPDAVASAICAAVKVAAAAAIKQKGSFSMAIPSGSVVKALSALGPADVEWSKVHVFFTNENLGKFKSYQGALDDFATKCKVPLGQVYKHASGDKHASAAAYATALAACAATGADGSVDLVLLGTGADGHCASLYPKSAELAAAGSGQMVLAKAEEDSVTVSIDFINSAKQVILGAAEGKRAGMVYSALTLGAASGMPTGCVAAARTVWCVDAAAFATCAAQGSVLALDVVHLAETATVAAELAPAPAAAAAAAAVPEPAAPAALVAAPVVAPAAPKVAPKVSPLHSSAALLAEFNNAAAAGGSRELDKGAFVALVKQLLAPAAANLPKPSDTDLAVAFRVADADKSGSVDVFEFMRLFNLIKAGKVTGLGAKPSMFATRSGAAKKSAAFKASLLSASDLRALFAAKAVFFATQKALEKPAFVALLKELLAGSAAAPSEKDWEAAFVLADEDRSGQIDVQEFLKIVNVAKAGKVKGLGTAFQGSAAARLKVEAEYKAGCAASVALGVGDNVCWTDADGDLPAGTAGQVLCVHGDGDVEVLFPVAGGGAQVFTFAAAHLKIAPLKAALGKTAAGPKKSTP